MQSTKHAEIKNKFHLKLDVVSCVQRVKVMRVTSEGTFDFKLPLLVSEERTAQAQLMISSADHILGDYNFRSLCYADMLCGLCIWLCYGLQSIRCLQSVHKKQIIRSSHQTIENPPVLEVATICIKSIRLCGRDAHFKDNAVNDSD